MDYAPQIYQQLLQGSPKNGGLPDALARIVTTQSQWESGNYTSNVFNNALNSFGYGYNPKSDYQIGQYGKYGAYASVTDSVNEIIDYIYRRLAAGSFPALNTITTTTQYATLLKNAEIGAYFEDDLTHYANGLQGYLASDVFDSGNVVSDGSGDDTGSLLLLAGIAIGAYFVFK